MKIFEPYKGFYDFRYLPQLANFIRNTQLQGFVEEQINLGQEVNVPLLANLKKIYSDEELIKMSLLSADQFLNYLSENRSFEQIHDSTDKWLKDQLEIIGKFEIEAEDITLINFLRQQALKKYIPYFTTDLKMAIELSSEVDKFITGSITTSCNVYLNMLKEKIEDESNLSLKLMQASPAITYVYDLIQKKEIFINGKIKEVMGYDQDELLMDKDFFILEKIYPDDKEIILNHLDKISRDTTNKMHLLEFRFKHKDGTYRWLRSYEVVFKRDNVGKPIETLGKIIEFTKEKQTALDLEKRENQLLEAQSIAHIGSYDWNIKKNRSFNSPEVYRIFEMNKQQRYEEFMTYVHPDDLEKVKDAIEQSFITGHYKCEYRYVKNNNEKVIISLGKLEFENQKPVRMVGTVQDITELKRIEKELLVKTKELERSNESLQQFAYIASHDLKEPLRKINMFTDIVLSTEKEQLTEVSKDNLLKIQKASASMRKMVDDVLSFSTMESEQEKCIYSLEKIVKEVIELLDLAIHEKKANIKTDKLPRAYLIPSQFRQLFQNLISNSLKFSRNGIAPEISIEHKWLPGNFTGSSKHSKKYLELTIKDNGIGFSNEYNEKVFELFRRLHNKSSYEGSGLGLSIARKIVTNHGGTISVESEEGVGSSFRIVIPQVKN